MQKRLRGAPWNADFGRIMKQVLGLWVILWMSHLEPREGSWCTWGHRAKTRDYVYETQASTFCDLTSTLQGFPGGTRGKESACRCRRLKRCRFYPWVKKIPCSRKWQSIPVFMPGRFPWTGETGGLQSVRLQRLRYDWAHTHTHTHPPARTVQGWHFDARAGEGRWVRGPGRG